MLRPSPGLSPLLRSPSRSFTFSMQNVSVFHGGLIAAPAKQKEDKKDKKGQKNDKKDSKGGENKENSASAANGVTTKINQAVANYSPYSLIMQQKPVPSKLSLDEKMKRCLAVADHGGEVIQKEELQKLLSSSSSPICYDGFEPSGRMHIAQGVMKAINVNRLTDCGCVFVFWVADWFGLLNNKMGGDLEKIKKVGEYFIEVWKAVGMNMDNVRFLWASEEINKNPSDYWLRVMNIARANNLTRIKKCGQIMGRGEGDEMPSSQIMYPCMQCADIFYLKADICQLGLDQRKVNMLAREYMDKPECQEQNKTKPVILSHGMLPGLKQGQEKMSKSDPDSAIFMEDSEADVKRKIKKSFCPEKQLEDNPCVAYVKMLVFPKFGEFKVQRKPENGGDKVYTSLSSFEADFSSGALHPSDLKLALADSINQMIEPVRKHFQENSKAKELLEEIKGYRVTK